MKVEPFARAYEQALIVGVAMTPSFAIWYLWMFSPTPPLVFENHGFHELAIALATLIGLFISYVSWRCYQASGEVFLRWLTAGFLAFTLIYAPHGILTRTAHDNIWLFILYGPASRLAMMGFLAVGLQKYGKPTEDPAAPERHRFWWRLIVGCAVTNVAVAILAYSPIASAVWVRLTMEMGAILLGVGSVVILYRRRVTSPLMVFYAVALVIFSQAALAFILAKPWDHMWWLAHVIFAGGFFIISWGIMQALRTTQSFVLAYSQEHLIRTLRIEKARSDAANQELARANADLALSQTDLTAANQQLESQNARLEESEGHLADVIEWAHDAIISIDSQHRIVVFNPAAQTMFGQAQAAMLGHTLDALLPQQLRAKHIDHVRSFVRGDPNSHRMGGARQLFGLRSDGIEFPIEASISRFRSNGEWHSTVILRDITQRMAAEAALAQSRELARSNADLEQFAYAASHDLIEPLRSVKSSVQFLQKRYATRIDIRADEYIAHAVSGVTRMQALINDLLTFSKVANTSRQATEISMESALTAAISNLQVAIAESSARITHDLPPRISAQGTQITMLLQNLLANAIKFRGDKTATVHVGAHQAGREWVFSVADQGIGITPKHFNRIFELFKRLHTHDEYPGTGIGLSLCKKIVERHGGRIWVESTPGRGTTFFFTLPTTISSDP
jgi:PAS domain S-box-containing protein